MSRKLEYFNSINFYIGELRIKLDDAFILALSEFYTQNQESLSEKKLTGTQKLNIQRFRPLREKLDERVS